MQPKTAKRRSAFRRANRPMPRRRIDIAIEAIDYKNPDLLKKFVTESGKILPRRVTGMPAHLHRRITREIKRSRSALLMKCQTLAFDRRFTETPYKQLDIVCSSRLSEFFRLARSVSRIRESHPAARLRIPAVCCGKGNRETCSCEGRDGL